jgi:predicted amidohydrolase YtcJ
MQRNQLLLVLILLLTSCSLASPPPAAPINPSPAPGPTESQAASPPAEVIFTGGQILTMETDHPTAEAIAIRRDAILAVGSEAEVMAYRGPATRLIDLDGLTLMPGFVDAHSHIVDASGGDIEKFAGIQAAALQGGMTTTTEMFVTPDILNRLRGYDHVRRLQLRFNTYLLYNTNCGEPFDPEWYKTYKPGENMSPKIRNQGVKIFADGGSCNVPAVSFEYPGGYGTGDLYMTQEQMNNVVAEAQGNGYQVAIHALGDRAVEQALSAIAAALDGKPNTFRHRIEHNALVRPDMLGRYDQIGVVPTFFGAYPTCWLLNPNTRFKYVEPPEYHAWEWPWRAILDANPGVMAAWHADYPVFAEISPLAHLYGFVTRNEVAADGSICEAPGWLKQGAITTDEALHIMTIHSAYALFRDDELGSLKAGKLADLIILSGNPEAIPPEHLKDLQVLMTMIGGNVEYCASGRDSLCP